MRNAHIINIETGSRQASLNSGSLGVGIILGGNTSGKLSSACQTSCSMYADMATIRTGDFIFVHEGEHIYGGFEAKSKFSEDPRVNPLFLSSNMKYHGGLNQLVSQTIPQVIPEYFRRLAIGPLTIGARNVCFQEGVKSTKLFDLKAKGRIWTIPERWKYADSSRIVRPLMLDEAEVILELIELESRGQAIPTPITPSALAGYLPITPIFDPNQIDNEKLIECWIVQNIEIDPQLQGILGEFTCFGNNIPIGYLKLMDIYGYLDLPSGARVHKVIEVKKGPCNFPDDIQQLVKYMHYVSMQESENRENIVEGYIVAKTFDQATINFVQTRNLMDARINLVQFDYVVPQNTLAVQSIV